MQPWEKKFLTDPEMKKLIRSIKRREKWDALKEKYKPVAKAIFIVLAVVIAITTLSYWWRG